MAELPDERQLVLGARSQLDRWTKSARREAYVELFDGDDPVLSPKRCNCSMRSTRNWSDRAAMVSGDRSVRNSHDGDLEFEYLTRGGLRLPSTDHHRFRPPRRDDLDDETEERLNAALWKYSEHVATLIETQLNEFVHQN